MNKLALLFLLLIGKEGYCRNYQNFSADPYTRDQQMKTLNRYIERKKLSIDITQQPHHVSIFAVKENYYVVCGGSIIGAKWILTGGLCKGKNTTVHVGSNEMELGTPYTVKRSWHMHAINSSLNKIVLLELQNNLTFTESVKAIPLGNYSDIVVGKNATLTSYNLLIKDEYDYEYIHGLVQGQYRLTECRGDLRKLPWEFCGVNDTKIDIDCGESKGAGLVIDGKLIGVARRLPGCHKSKSQGIFASVPPFRDWIEKVIGVETP